MYLTDINEDVLMAYALEKGEFSYTSLLNDFVKAGKCAKGTLLHYKNDLEDDGSLKKKIDSVTGRPVYFIPAAIRRKMEARNIFNKIVESAKAEELENLVAVLQKDVERLNCRQRLYSLFLDCYDGHHQLREWLNAWTKNPHIHISTHETLEEYIAKFEKTEAEGAVFEETLAEAWIKGWINDNERFLWTVHYRDFINVLARFKKSSIEFKNNWHVVEMPTAENKELDSKEVQCSYCSELMPTKSLFCPKCGKIRKEKAIWEQDWFKTQF